MFLFELFWYSMEQSEKQQSVFGGTAYNILLCVMCDGVTTKYSLTAKKWPCVRNKKGIYWLLATALTRSVGYRGHDLCSEGKAVAPFAKRKTTTCFLWLIAVFFFLFFFFFYHKHSSFDDACPCWAVSTPVIPSEAICKDSFTVIRFWTQFSAYEVVRHSFIRFFI